MGAQAATAQVPKLQVPQWRLSSRLAFRFCFIYLGFFCVSTQPLASLISSTPNVDVPNLGTLWPMRQLTFWVAAHIFHARLPLIYTGSGSGDKTFDWVWIFCLMVFAILATGVWSVLDRHRENYVTLHKWFRLFIRFALAGQMLTYGMYKVIPLQMSFPSLTRLLVPYGNFSPMGVLWSSIGASTGYEIFAGCAEMLGGILIVFPRTTMLGALVCLADMTQVFMLNMTYDVPVKLHSFHMLLMAVFLLAPESQRLADFFFHNRAARPSTQPQLFQTLRANRIALGVQIMLGIWLLGANAYGAWTYWATGGGGRPKPPLYGIWNVDELSIDGQLRSPLLIDYGRWRRAVSDLGNRMAFQRMDDSFARYSAAIDANRGTIALTKDGDKNWKSHFTFQRVSRDRLVLDGDMDSHKIHMQLQLAGRDKFLLVNRGFHWIQEYPINR